MSPLPIVVCGKILGIIEAVKEGLLPEYEVIHVVTDAQTGSSEIPSLLSGKNIAGMDNMGSKNYSQPPVAVATGGGFDDEQFNLMRNACKGIKVVPWLRPDMSKAKDGPSLSDMRAFGKHTAERVKRKLTELGVSGEAKEEWKTEVYLF